MYSYNSPSGGVMQPRQHRCNVVRELTPLLRGIGRVDDGELQDETTRILCKSAGRFTQSIVFFCE